MQEYTITRISRANKVSARTNKPYESVGIQVAEFGLEWINGFGNKDNASWKEGDKVKMVIKDEVYNGKTSKKFELPKAQSMNNEMLEKVYGNQLLIIKEIKHIKAYLVAKFGVAEAPKDPNMPEYPENNLEPTI